MHWQRNCKRKLHQGIRKTSSNRFLNYTHQFDIIYTGLGRKKRRRKSGVLIGQKHLLFSATEQSGSNHGKGTWFCNDITRLRTVSGLFPARTVAFYKPSKSISFEEVELTEDLYNEMTCIFMKSPETSYTLNVNTGETSKNHISQSNSYGQEEEKLLSEVKILKSQLDNLENSSLSEPDEAGDSTEDNTGCPIVPNSIWDELSELTSDVFENIAPEIINSLIDLDNKKKESEEKLKIVSNDYHESNFRSRMWLEFAHQMWPPSLKGDSTLLNNDLKNLICGKNSKLRANLVQLERIRLALKQQKLKDRTFQVQARNETKMILEIVKSIRQNEQERLILLGEKLDKAESFHQYRNHLKKRLEKMKSERDQNLKKEEEKLKKEEEKRLKIEKEKRDR